jgi:hypothetical protein
MTGHSLKSGLTAAMCAAMLTFATQSGAQGAAATPALLWQMKLPEGIVSLATARNGACVAVRTRSRVYVLDGKGNRSWETADVLSAEFENGVHAVSPQCDWVAVSWPSNDPTAHGLLIVGRNGASKRVPLEAAINVNGPYINTLDVSPDGKLLVVGFATGYLWIVTRDGEVRTRVGPLQGAGVRARFTSDGSHVLVTGWFNDGLMNLDGTWAWEYRTRELLASGSYDRFAALTAPMHGRQYGDVAMLDASGKELWTVPVQDAAIAMAPDGSFIALSGKSEKADQPTEPPFPIAPLLNATPEIWIHGRDGKVLAHEELQARVIGVTGDSSCVLVAPDYSDGTTPSNARHQWIAGFNRSLKETWRLDVSMPDSRRVVDDLLFDYTGNELRAYRIPSCER